MGFWEILAAALLLVTAVLVVTARNAVHAALALIANFLVLAGVYVSLDARFLGLVQIIVYAGAIVVLFLFVIMLLSAAQADVGINPLSRLTPVAALGAIALAAVLMIATRNVPAPQQVGNLNGGLPQAIGPVLYGPWLYALLAVGFLLLVATVAAVALVQPEKPLDALTDEEKVRRTPASKEEVRR
ncbi:MAG TPA: NADH-quinone oxidoreductase subunit J [Meiothermus sp.]|jgi:NADH-quinone oxidoreductase subunit J|nr:NADH-quinone oxidoreductase subunit J [Meiothermus sp.]